MKKSVVKSGTQRSRELLSHIDVQVFKNFAKGVMELRGKDLLEMEFMSNTSVVSYTGMLFESLQRKFNLSKKQANEIMEILTNILYYSINGNEEEIIKRMEKTELKGKCKELIDFVKQLESYESIRNKYLVDTYSKNKYFRDLEWEINIKKVQEQIDAKKSPPNFPVCSMRLFLESAPPLTKVISNEKVDAISMDLSVDDISKLITKLTRIREKFVIELENLKE